jgi:hypothetical protein
MKLAVIGSAGRYDDQLFVTEDVYDKMLYLLEDYILELDEEIILVSGGASFSDHLIVTTYLANTIKKDLPIKGIELHLPSEWDYIQQEYSHDGAGKTSNYWHKNFSKKVLGYIYNSLEEIDTLVKSSNDDVKIFFYNGFKKRNLVVGNVDVLLAFTASATDNPKPGGTAHTWRHSDAKIRKHYNLFDIYKEVNEKKSTTRLNRK